jgi:hypothetical protein
MAFGLQWHVQHVLNVHRRPSCMLFLKMFQLPNFERRRHQRFIFLTQEMPVMMPLYISSFYRQLLQLDDNLKKKFGCSIILLLSNYQVLFFINILRKYLH